MYPLGVRPSARVVFVLLYGALVFWQVDRWFFTPHGVASTWRHPADGVPAVATVDEGVVQTFHMGADGLDGIRLRPVVSDPAAVSGTLVVELQTVGETGRSRLERVEVPAREVAGRRTLHVPFRPQSHTRGEAMAIAVWHVDAGAGPAIAFATTRQDVLPGESFQVGTDERWGELLFETTARRAALVHWIPEILGAWPGWLREWPTVIAVVVLLNVALIWACAIAAGLTSPRRADRSVDVVEGSDDAGRAVRPDPARAAGAVVFGIVVTGVWLLTSGGETPPGRLGLLDVLPEARLSSSHTSIHEAFSITKLAIADGRRETLVALPTSRVVWDVAVPRGAVLHVTAGQRPDMLTAESDGIVMRIAVEQGDERSLIADLTLFPFGVGEHQQLFPLALPLDRWAGQHVQVVFETTPERWGNAVNDVPVWVAPRIEWPVPTGRPRS